MRNKKKGDEAPAQPVAVLPKNGITLPERDRQHEVPFKQLATDVIVATAQVGEKYLGLATYIRRTELAPTSVTVWLTDLGFAKSRISEIHRVANVPDELWNAYQVKALGWKKVLDAARGRQAVLDFRDMQGDAAETLTAPQGDLALPGDTTKKKHGKSSTIAALNRACVKALQMAHKVARMATKKGEPAVFQPWNVGNGWQLTIAKADKKQG